MDFKSNFEGKSKKIKNEEETVEDEGAELVGLSARERNRRKRISKLVSNKKRTSLTPIASTSKNNKSSNSKSLGTSTTGNYNRAQVGGNVGLDIIKKEKQETSGQFSIVVVE